MSARSLRRSRGFTLVEVMVSLVAGLLIAMAVIALSKTATNTFHEEVRNATVEASLRTASERLRNDLVRVAFMGTGNALLDPKMPKPKSGLTLKQRYGAEAGDLQGIRIYLRGATSTGTDASLLTNPTLNNLHPDRIDMVGNYTTDDAYRMQWVTTGSCGGPKLQMKPAGDAALARLIGGVDAAGTPLQNQPTANLLVQAAFTPGTGSHTYWARAVDARGCPHYVEICASGYDGTYVWVDVKSTANDKGILTPYETTDFCGGNPLETEFSVNPMIRVTWDIIPSNDGSLAAATKAAVAPDPGIEAAGTKHLLVRKMWTVEGTPVVVNAPEIIAEYAIDMKFGTIFADPLTNVPKIADMDPEGDVSSGFTAAGTTPPVDTTPTIAGQIGPQRVRAVRYRLSVRTALPDRRTNLSIFPSVTTANQAYLVRYCMDSTAGSMNACKKFARVRTLVSETALTNQARFNY